MQRRTLIIAGIAAMTFGARRAWAPEPGMGSNNNASSESGPGHEGSTGDSGGGTFGGSKRDPGNLQDEGGGEYGGRKPPTRVPSSGSPGAGRGSCCGMNQDAARGGGSANHDRPPSRR